MSIITIAVCIVAGALAWLILWAGERNAWPSSIAIALAIFVALIVFAGGPALWGAH